MALANQTATKDQPKIALIGDNARTVMERLWLKRDENRDLAETPFECMKRVAHHVAQGEPTPELREKWEQEFLEMLVELQASPNSPAYTGAGRKNGMLSACFVLPVEDSIEDIFEQVKRGALVHKGGGGTGYAFDRIREAGALVSHTNGIASGPLSFLNVYDEATETIKQGSARRGANMGCLSVSHPDILDFITCKDRCDTCPTCNHRPPYANFNLSVKITDAFMAAVLNDSTWDLISPADGRVVRTLPAREIFDKIAFQAWKNGEPGVLFIDKMNRSNPTPEIGAYESTNPCGETALLPCEACCLASIHLANHLTYGSYAAGRSQTVAKDFDWKKLKRTVRTMVRFLDDLITVNVYPFPEITKAVDRTRKIGLGVMGWADALIRLGVPYASMRGVELAEKVMSFIQDAAWDASVELSKERGPFPAIEQSIWKDSPEKPRNATRTTIAPTGTISRVFEASQGIEPHFSLYYVKHVIDGPDLIYLNEDLEIRLKEELTDSQFQEAMEHIKETGSVQDLEYVSGHLKDLFKTALEIDPIWHLKMQAAFQKYTDNAVSKTVNGQETMTVEDVRNLYMKAYEMDVKGVTFYRNNSRNFQPMSVGTGAVTIDGQPVAVAAIPSPRKRGERLTGVTRRMITGCGKLYVIINFDEEGVCEIFCQLGKAGGCASAQMQTIGKLASTGLRRGVPVEDIVAMLKGTRCSQIAFSENGPIFSCADAIAKAIELEVKGASDSDVPTEDEEQHFAGVIEGVGLCPDCGNPLRSEGGCVSCSDPSCGFSRCG